VAPGAAPERAGRVGPPQPLPQFKELRQGLSG
jgi:hypothetical protein